MEVKNEDLPKNWKKINVLTGVVATLIIPITVIVIGNSFSTAIKDKEIKLKYVELAIDILNKGDQSNERTKKWAIWVFRSDYATHFGQMVPHPEELQG